MESVDRDFDRLAADRGLLSCPNKPIDRAANVALHLSRRGTAALFQRRLDENKFEYLIMGVGFMPALHNPPTSREIKSNEC